MISFPFQNYKNFFFPTGQVYSKNQTRVMANHILLSLASATSTESYNQKFPKINWEKIARRRLLIFKKYWNCKVFLCLRLLTITQLNSLFGATCLCCIFSPLSVNI